MAGTLSFPFLSTAPSPRCSLARRRSGGGGGGRKHSERLLSSLSAAADSAAADRILRKFVSSSSKSTSLQTLSLLLSRSSPFALPIYRRISETHWFKWSPNLAAELISLLYSNDGSSAEADALLADSVSRLASRHELALFYCRLVDAAADRGLKRLVLDSCGKLGSLEFSGRKAYESVVKGLSSVGMPADAEEVLDEMSRSGFVPSSFEYRSVVRGYGSLGRFADMERVVNKVEEERMIDTVCANTILSCYGQHGRLPEMVTWVVKMRESGIGFSIRTFNTVSNSCPGLVSMVTGENLGTDVPLSISELMEKLQGSSDEKMLVRELVSSPLLDEILKWSQSEAELDLHGFHVSAALVVILQWMREMRCRLTGGSVVPMEFSIVCGSGKHSSVHGESPVRKLVSHVMVGSKSPMKIDRKNVGRFVAKGKTVRDWLCCNCC